MSQKFNNKENKNNKKIKFKTNTGSKPWNNNYNNNNNKTTLYYALRK